MPGKKNRSPQRHHLFLEVSTPSIPAASALSFLRETRGVSTWTARDMASALKISVAHAKRAIPVLELQGYVKPAGADGWMTTRAGEEVSGSKPPRFIRERVKQALDELRRRVEEKNRDLRAVYRITRVVALGDFLSSRPRVQRADIGVQLAQRGQDDAHTDSAKDRAAKRAFLKQLEGKGGVVHVVPFEKWMAERSHLDLL